MSEIHTGHRSRLTRRALAAGLDRMPAHEALEFLLYFVLPRGDVNPLAHALIDRFGTVTAVLHAEKAELLSVDGLGPRAAEYLTLLGTAMDEYLAAEYEPETLARRESAGPVLRALFERGGDPVSVILMNSAFQVLESVACDKNTVIRAAVMSGATAAFGAVRGEPAREALTRLAETEEALGRIGIPLVNCAFYVNGEIRYMKDEWGTDE